ncbi:MAG: hypothetical protein P8P87_05245 [Crocinitomicaceae bacterium]|nr:hypothetical protein [Crocinitomicaceae bacterium]
MSKQGRIGLLIGIICFMLLMVWLFSSGEGSDNPDAPVKKVSFVSSNWNKKYLLDDKNPLGLYMFTALAQSHLDTNKHIEVVEDWIGLDSITDADENPKTYMFVGNIFQLKNKEMDSILSDVHEGSELFLAFENLTENIFPKLFNSFEYRSDYSEEVNVFVENKKFNMINLYQNDTIAKDWWAFGELDFDEEYVGLSSFMEMPNFVRVKHGKGFVYLHATPSMFQNYQVKRIPGFKYAAYCLNNIPRDNDIYMLELGRRSDDYGNYDTDDQSGKDLKNDDSYLQLIFKNPTLLIALLLTILGLILFIIFRSKRTRPIVPFIPKRKDMTLAFAETITSIYFAKRNPYGLLQVQKKNFYDTVHRYFFVDLYHRVGDRELLILAEKSDTDIQEIKKLVQAYETKEASQVSEQFVAQITKEKYQFYRRVGIISDDFNDRLQAQEMVFKRSMWLPSLYILGGIALILIGLYLLVSAAGIGIVLWPIGSVLLVLGILRLSKPYLIVSKDKIIHYTTFAQKKEFHRPDLLNVESRKTGVIITFRNNNSLIINYWDLSNFDRKQFERFISKLHMNDL